MTMTDIPGLGAISAGEATDLLVRTGSNNLTGRVGGPYTRDGYTLPDALAMLERADRVRRGAHLGIPTVIAQLPDQGVHVWYINLVPAKANPWA